MLAASQGRMGKEQTNVSCSGVLTAGGPSGPTVVTVRGAPIDDAPDKDLPPYGMPVW